MSSYPPGRTTVLPPALSRPPSGGLHLAEWGSELAGTAILVFGGLSAVCLDFGHNTPVEHLLPSSSLRLLLTGLLFAGTGSLVTISPLGRRSGAHINPSVTLAFWAGGHVSRDDLFGYLAGQFLGASIGALLLRLVWGAISISVQDGSTSPKPGVGAPQAIGIEALMTAILVITIFGFTSFARTARWTPLALWIVIALLVWQGAPFTDCSLNPARSFGPDLVSGHWGSLWIYLIGPPAGALAAVGLYVAVLRERRPLTAKLFHDSSYPSVLGGSLPVAPGRRRSG